MLNKIIKTIQHYNMFQEHDSVVAGVSGGADSVALLLVLLELREALTIKIHAAHINHGLRGEASDADEAFVRELCETKGVPLRVYAADVRGLSRAEGVSLEEAGRLLRYQFLEQALREIGCLRPSNRAPENGAGVAGGKIAMAHHRGDGAETVLLNLFRGTGLRGLGGIPPVRGYIVRPLIDVSRSEAERYLAERGQPFCTDESNASPAYARNRVRHQILPLIREQFGPQAAENITRGAALLRADEEFLTQAAHDAYVKCAAAGENAAHDNIVRDNIPGNMDGGNAAPARPFCEKSPLVILDISHLTAFPPAITHRVIREAVSNINGLRDIGAAHVEAVLALTRGQTGRVAVLPRGMRARREYGQLVLYKYKIESPENKNAAVFNYPLYPGTPVYIPALQKYIAASLTPPSSPFNGYTKVFRYDRINMRLTVRTRLPGDRIYWDGVGHRKLQDYFTDRKIPRRERDAAPLLADGGEIIWILDGSGRASGKYKPQDGTEQIYISLYEE